MWCCKHGYTIMATIRKAKGFTLLEVLVSMLVIAAIAATSANFLASAFTGYFTGINSTGLSLEAAVAMKRMDLELKKAVSFSTINANQVTFTTLDGQTITYNLSGTTLNRTVTTALPLASSVTALTFNYYNSNFVVTATPTAVRAVTYSLTISNGSQTVSLINTVYIANMK